MNDDECLAEFRVDKSELNALAETLIIPDQFRCPNGTVASRFEGPLYDTTVLVVLYPSKIDRCMHMGDYEVCGHY